MSTATLGFETYLDFTNTNEILLTGTRIGLEQIVEAYEGGASAEEIAWRFPAAKLDQIHATIAYYLSHKDDVKSYISYLQSPSTLPIEEMTIELRRNLDKRHQVQIENGRIHINSSTL